MPLTRHEIIGHDPQQLAFQFTMLNGSEVVQYQISDVALDDLAGMEGTEGSVRLTQFLSMRDTIEKIASLLFDERTPPVSDTSFEYLRGTSRLRSIEAHRPGKSKEE
ncbi:MAG: hypothetical protein PVS2B2_26970 [Candidatus Acidiferrum sp.]